MSETPNLLPPKEDLLTTCELASLVYNKDEIQNKYPQGTFFERSRCFVVTINKITYITYRGTEITSISDILADLNAKKVHPFGKGNGLIHEGFFQRSRYNFGISIDAKEDKYDEGSILDLIEKSESERLIFTGHSLGGAVAELSFLRYITFCENFSANTASRYKNKCSYIVYAAPINTSIEIRDRFEKYSSQMHSIDKFNDPIIEIVRDAERILYLHKSKQPSEIDSAKVMFMCDSLDEGNYDIEEDDDYDDNNLKEVKMLRIVTEEYYNQIRTITDEDEKKVPDVVPVANKTPILTSIPVTVLSIFKPTSIAMGIHHINMKDNSLFSSKDSDKISEIFSEIHSILSLKNHKMNEYIKFVNNIINEYLEYI